MMLVVEKPANTGDGKANPFIVKTKGIDWEETCYKKLGTTRAENRKKFADWIDANRHLLVPPNIDPQPYVQLPPEPEYYI